MEKLNNTKDVLVPEQERNVYSLIRKNSPYVFLERSLIPIINFIITVFIIRTLIVNEFGIYQVLLAVMSYVALLSSLGLLEVFRRFIPEFFQKKKFAMLKVLVEKGLFWRSLLCIGIVLIIIIFSRQIGNLLKFQQAMQYFAIFSIGIIFHLSSTLLSSTLISLFQHKLYLISQIIYVLFRAGLIYILLSMGKGLLGLLIAESAAYGLLFVIYFFFYRRFLSRQSFEKKTEFSFRRLIRFGRYSYFNEAGAQILSVSTDYFIISAFLGPVAVGIYGFANKVMTLVSRILPQSMFVNIIRPAFFMKYVQNEDSEQVNRMFNFLTKIIVFFSFPLMLGIIILGDKLIIYVFDPKYLESLTVLWIVAAFHSIDHFMGPISLVLQSKEKVQILLYSKIFAVYNLLGDLLVVKTFGVVGIAVVTSSAIFFKNFFCFLYAKKYANIKLQYKGLATVIINSLIMAIIIYLLRPQIKNLLTFILVVIIGAVVYIGAAFFNKTFTDLERNKLNQILPKPIFIF